MMRILIVDDEKNAREILAKSLEILNYANCIVGQAENIQEAEKMIYKHQPNLIFLDIEMPYGNGFDLLNKVTQHNFMVVFTTAYNDYAISAIKFNALDYLLKPIDIFQLKDCVEKAKLNLNNAENEKRIKNLNHVNKNPKSKSNKLVIKYNRNIHYIELNKIMYCHSNNQYTNIVMSDNCEKMASMNIGEYEMVLDDYQFKRVHTSYIVNKDYVQSLTKKEDKAELILKNGFIIPVSRRRKTEVIKWLEGE